MKTSQNYPDISDILQRKAEGRREIAARTFGEKIAMVEAMQKRISPFKRLKEQRENEQSHAHGR
jgi:hypothetical protein